MATRSLVRTIEKLEALAAQMRGTTRQVFERALHDIRYSYGVSQFESLITAVCAERTGRPLNENELAARQEFWSVVKRECQWGQIALPETCPPEILLAAAQVTVFASYWNFQVARSGYDAAERGQEPTEEQLTALRELDALNARLAELAGFDSVEEFNLCTERAYAKGAR